MPASNSQKLPVVHVDIRLAAPRTLPAETLLDLGVGRSQVVLESGEAVAAGHVRESHSIAGIQQFGVVLHEAFEAGGRLEFGLGGVCVLGIDELVYESVRALQHLHVGLHLDGETVDVSGERAVPLFIDLLAARLLEKSLQLVVFHVDGQQFFVLFMHESSDGANCLAGLAGDCQTVEVEVPLRRNTQQQCETAQSEGIGVLEDDDPLAALTQPFLRSAVHVQQGMHVAVSMGLGLDLQPSAHQAEPAFVVDHRWHLLLVEDGHLVLPQSKVFVVLEEFKGLGVGVLGCHDDEGDGFAITVFCFEGVDVLAVVLQEALFSEQFLGNGDLDALVTQPLSQSPGHQHECCPLELSIAQLFVLFPGLEVVVGDGDALGLAHLVVFVRINTKGRLLQQPNPVLVVGLQSSRICALYFGDLGVEFLLLLFGGSKIGVSNVVLVDAPQQLNVHTNKYKNTVIKLFKIKRSS